MILRIVIYPSWGFPKASFPVSPPSLYSLSDSSLLLFLEDVSLSRRLPEQDEAWEGDLVRRSLLPLVSDASRENTLLARDGVKDFRVSVGIKKPLMKKLDD
ncbi:hypothetical protein Tco_0933367 [Tanacetum coccineum]